MVWTEGFPALILNIFVGATHSIVTISVLQSNNEGFIGFSGKIIIKYGQFYH